MTIQEPSKPLPGRLARWLNVRRKIRNNDPDVLVYREARRRLKRATKALREAGLTVKDHFEAKTRAEEYCKCGTVQDHNQLIDLIVERENR